MSATPTRLRIMRICISMQKIFRVPIK